ncbi:MAG TPA: HAMP domain-containing sensor histidine kinase [Vicinamibacterales bacterium]|nr:HAMP domain-containing sensor histidine kinase [Vicinamibacterales bacterium]
MRNRGAFVVTTRERRWPPLSWLSLGLLALLTGLAILQYRWLGQVSEAERQRLQAGLQARAGQFADEFDREIARAFFHLQVDPESLQRDDWTRYAERYDRWQAAVPHPRLVSELWLFAPGADPRRYDSDARAFQAAPLPSRLEPLWKNARTDVGNRNVAPGAGIRWFHAVHDDIPAIVAPIPDVFRFPSDAPLRIEHVNPLARHGFVVIMLDDRYLRAELLPALAKRHFAAANGGDYHLKVSASDGRREVFSSGPALDKPDAPPDVSVGLFDVRLEILSDLRAAERGVPGRAGAAMDRRLAVSVVERSEGGRRMERVNLPGPRWRLELRHRAGSLEAAVGAARRRNLVLSSGILALLGASMIMLVVAAHRASQLAAQQIKFVAAVSHELRTPLAVIRSAGENLADGLVSEPGQVQTYGELVRAEGRRLTTMVEQVLAFAGVKGSQVLQRQAVHARELVDRATDAVRADLDGAGLRVEADVPENLRPALLDVEAVVRALANLLSNAAKYAAGGGLVRVAVREGAGRELQIAVQDRGPGIAPDDLPHIFEPFFRSSAVIASRVHGTGLGLSLVDAIVRAHGGRVLVRSDPGRGCTFTLHFPHAVVPASASVTDPLPASRP